MRQGFRPKLVRQIFAPVPAARSRCLASFIAIARQGLPLLYRYEASSALAVLGVVLVSLGMLPLIPSGAIRALISVIGYVCMGLCFAAILNQHKFEYGTGRSRLIRSLDEARRYAGLDEAILPESLEFLEASAFQWERIEHAMQTQPWQMQTVLRPQIGKAAHLAMEEILFLECGNNSETGFDDEEADRRLLTCANSLRLLADAVDAAGSVLATYPRAQFDSNGENPTGVLTEMQDLEDALDRIRDVLSRSEGPA